MACVIAAASACTADAGSDGAGLTTHANAGTGAANVFAPAGAAAGATDQASVAADLPMSAPMAAESAGASGTPASPDDAQQPMAAAAGGGGKAGSAASEIPPAPSSCPPPPAGASVAEISALNTVNTLREAAGSPCVNLDLTIGKAAAAHCAYYALNKDTNPTCVANPHYEVMGCPGFTGATPVDRMRAAGFDSTGGGEVMAFLDDPIRSVRTWVDSVWHRIPMLDPATTVLGYGSAEGCDTISFGPSKRSDALSLVAYPYNGQSGVTTAFDGRFEGPMPPAPATGWPSANPISLYGQQLVVTEHELFVDGDDTPLDHTWLDPFSPLLPADQQRLLLNVVFMYANQPYLPNTRYRVRIAGTYAGGPLEKEWTFTTGIPPQRRGSP